MNTNTNTNATTTTKPKLICLTPVRNEAWVLDALKNWRNAILFIKYYLFGNEEKYTFDI
jgi:hypothetical protein